MVGDAPSWNPRSARCRWVGVVCLVTVECAVGVRTPQAGMIMRQAIQGSVRQDMERDRAVYDAQRRFGQARRAGFMVCTPVLVYLSVRMSFGDGVDGVFDVLARALGA